MDLLSQKQRKTNDNPVMLPRLGMDEEDANGGQRPPRVLGLEAILFFIKLSRYFFNDALL